MRDLWWRAAILMGATAVGMGSVALAAKKSAPANNHDESAEAQDSPSPSGGVVDNSKPLVIHGPLVRLGADGKLQYKPYDAQGDTIPDFSNSGYRGGGVALPKVPTKLTVNASGNGGDDTERLQKAIDAVSAMAADEHGIRGVLQLGSGTFHVSGSLKISSGGVVLRGSGSGEGGTLIVATGSEVRPMIEIKGGDGIREGRQATKITDAYVPVGAHHFTVENGADFHVGDSVIVRRIGNAAWIHELKMDQLIERSGTKQWEPFNLDADRAITAVDGNTITIDAPIVCAIDQHWGGGEVLHYTDAGRIQQCGVENLHADSTFDPSVTSTVGVAKGGEAYPADEKHATDAVSLDDCKNCWVQHVAATHFVHGVAKMLKEAKWVTVADSQASEPVSIITGGRRYPFNIEGQLCLVIRCDAKGERHAFVDNGSHMPGPSAFVLSTSEDNHADSGPHQRWSCGVLWDNITGVMHSQDRQDMGSGHGWAGANDVYWNCSGTITIEQPETAENFAFGFVGQKQKPAFAQLHHPSGYYESFGTPVEPKSLYLQQLKDRLGEAAVEAIGAKSVSANATSD